MHMLNLFLQTCVWAHNAIRKYESVYSRKLLSVFGLRASPIARRATHWDGIATGTDQQLGTLSYRHNTKSLVEVRMASWRAGNAVFASACDDGLLARMQLTAPTVGDDYAPVLHVCSITAVPGNAEDRHPTGWVLLVDSARPLEISLSVELDLLVVLCARRE